MERNETFLQKAEALKPTLHMRRVSVSGSETPLKKGGSLTLDFGEHLVGTVTIRLAFVGSHPDAPAWLRLKFAEREQELSENVEDYHGWISASWVQQEQIHVDVLPCEVRLERRYAFRYVQLEVLDISGKYDLVVKGADCEAVSSADEAALLPYETEDAFLRQIDAVACKTLHDCMQLVFEDGPKRDRRLWMGDLRLQALANYQSYRNHDLVKRCLYLFAGSTLPGGRVGAGLFLEPEIEVDDTAMFDYSLLYVPTLLDYYETTGDRETLAELWPTAWRQIELVQAFFDDAGLVRDVLHVQPFDFAPSTAEYDALLLVGRHRLFASFEPLQVLDRLRGGLDSWRHVTAAFRLFVRSRLFAFGVLSHRVCSFLYATPSISVKSPWTEPSAAVPCCSCSARAPRPRGQRAQAMRRSRGVPVNRASPESSSRRGTSRKPTLQAKAGR